MQRGVSVVAYDEAPAGLEGPWATTARMETLRSPKQLAGPALGIPSLTFRAWFEAQFGRDAWDALDKIPRLQWMDYLRWYRDVLALPVRNGHRVTDLLPRGDGLVELGLEADGPAATRAWARRVVARDRPRRPRRPGAAGLRRGVAAQRAGRTRPTTTTTPRSPGLRVGVVGAGASAMDSAATALEAGAAHVHLLVRRADLPRVNKGKGAGNPGFVQGYARLPDDWKWRIRHYINTQQVPPPRNSTQRVSRHPNAHFHLGVAIEASRSAAARCRCAPRPGRSSSTS